MSPSSNSVKQSAPFFAFCCLCALLFATAIVAYDKAGLLWAIGACLALCVSFWLMRQWSPFEIKKLTLLSFWFLTFLVMHFFSAFFVYADQSDPARSHYLFSVISLLVTVPLGALVVSLLMNFRVEETEEFFRSPLVAPQVSQRLERRCLILLGACLLLTCLYFAEAPVIPLFQLTRNLGEANELEVMREESFKLLDSPLLYFYAVVRTVLFPFLIACGLGCYWSTRSRKWLWYFGLGAAAGVFFAALSLAKSPVAEIFLVLSLFVFIYQGRRISARQAVAFLLLLFAFPAVVILGLNYGRFGAWEVVNALGERMLYSPAEDVYMYFEVFPSHVEYLHGRSINKLSLLLGMNYFDTPNYVGQYGWPEFLETQNANAMFVGDLNADFGLPGVVLGGILAGSIIQGSHIFLVRRRKTVISLGCYAFLFYVFWTLHSVSLSVVLASEGSILVLFLTWWLNRGLADPARCTTLEARSPGSLTQEA